MKPNFLDPFTGDDRLPDSVDVVVIGGGIVGVSTALFLAERGVSVALCEKGRIGAEQSCRNWGWVRQMGREPVELPLTIESLRLWREMNARVGAETGFRQTGITYVYETEREADQYDEMMRDAQIWNVPTRHVGQAELSALLPGIAGRFLGGLHTATDGRAEPAKAAPAIAQGARTAGAHILTDCAVRGIERAAGRLSGVVTERGPIACGAAVLAGGAWSRLFAGNLGIDFPQLKVLGTALRVDSVDGAPEMPLGGSDFSLRKRLDGGFTVGTRNTNIAPIVPDSFRLFTDFLPTLIKRWSELRLRVGSRFIEEWQTPRSWNLDTKTPFERVRVLDPVPDATADQRGMSSLTRAFPAFAGARVTDRWAGLIDVTPDAVPVIGPADSIPGLYFASGFSGHGFGIGPGAGMLMADLVMGRTPCVDPHPFRLSRFRKARSKPVRAMAS